jgi:hypothetical protein
MAVTRRIAASFQRSIDAIIGESSTLLAISDSDRDFSCSPNALVSWNSLSFTLTLSTVRVIQKGSEVTISYIDPLQKRERRRAFLLSAYGFTCGCETCSQVTKNVQRSDKRREKLAAFFGSSERLTFKRWIEGREVGASSFNTPDAPVARSVGTKNFISQTTEIVLAIEGDGLQVLRAQYMEATDALVRANGVCGQDQSFKTAIEAAVDVWSVDARHSEVARWRVARYREWAVKVKSFPQWNSKQYS